MEIRAEVEIANTNERTGYAHSFLENDMRDILYNIYDKGFVNTIPIIDINVMENASMEEYRDHISMFIDKLRGIYGTTDHFVVVATAYISVKDVPELEPYEGMLYAEWSDLPDIVRKAAEENLQKRKDALEGAKFININDFVQYEFNEAYIYPNKFGVEILEYIKSNVNVEAGNK